MGDQATPSRTFVAIGFVTASLLTTGLTTAAAAWADAYKADRSDKITRVAAFIQSTQQFDPLVRDYMSATLDDGDVGATRVALEKNLQAQHILLGAADDHLIAGQLERAENYRGILVSIEEGLEKKTKDPLSGREFAQGVADAAAERERVIVDLRRSAGLSSRS